MINFRSIYGREAEIRHSTVCFRRSDDDENPFIIYPFETYMVDDLTVLCCHGVELGGVRGMYND